MARAHWWLALSFGAALLSSTRLHAEEPARTPQALPRPTARCPRLAEGTVRLLDHDVRVLALGARPHGPIVIYWHGTDSNPERELPRALGERWLARIRKEGGIVVGMLSGQSQGENTSGNAVWFDTDMRVADEVVACALSELKADPRRIHALGMSAGGLQTASYSYRRGYLASVVTYSGGHVVYNGRNWTDTTPADPANKFAALIFHGGPNDYVGMSFVDGGRSYFSDLRKSGHAVALCDHGLGHAIPEQGGELAMKFFDAHPYGSMAKIELPTALAPRCEL
jgi:dienelactone hydrolase